MLTFFPASHSELLCAFFCWWLLGSTACHTATEINTVTGSVCIEQLSSHLWVAHCHPFYFLPCLLPLLQLPFPPVAMETKNIKSLNTALPSGHVSNSIFWGRFLRSPQASLEPSLCWFYTKAFWLLNLLNIVSGTKEPPRISKALTLPCPPCTSWCTRQIETGSFQWRSWVHCRWVHE